MPVIPFGEWRPDLSNYLGEHSINVANVLPRLDGYGPFPAFVVYTTALAAACRGFFVARKTDGSVAIFAGTLNRLYLMDNTDFTWDDVSQGAIAYSDLPTADNWQFEQFGNDIIAVQANEPPQVFDLSSSTEFADLAGSPPQARYVRAVGRFLVLSGLLSNPFRVHWSGLNDIEEWTSGDNQSDFQDLPDGGIVRGVAGGEYGYIFQDSIIRRMTYAPGSPVIFQIDKIAEDDGLWAPYSLVRTSSHVFFLSPQGFKKIGGAGFPEPIGKERTDATFLADYDSSTPRLMIGAGDPTSTRVFWAYRSVNGQASLFDKIICYDWALDRWSTINAVGEFLATLSRPGLTLENLDNVSASIDALPFSLDDIGSIALPKLAAANSDHKIGFFVGDALEATIDTPEMGVDNARVTERGFRPVTDAGTVYGSLLKRETLQATATQTTEQLVNAVGICPQRANTRYARWRVRIPAETTWTFASGVEPNAAVAR